MTEHTEIPSGGPLTTAEAALLREWSSSLGRVSASFRVVWNGEAALVGIVQSGIALVRADDSAASGFARTHFALSAPAEDVRVLTLTRNATGSSQDEATQQSITFADADSARELDQHWQLDRAALSNRNDLERWIPILANVSDVVMVFGGLTAVLGLFGSIALLAHTVPGRDQFGDTARTHDLVGYGLAGLLGTAVTVSLLIAVGAIGKVLALQHRSREATDRAGP